MVEPQAVINLKETIGKQVGRTDPPTDALRVASGMNRLATRLLKASGHRLQRRGLFRFRPHEEANQSMTTMGPKAKT